MKWEDLKFWSSDVYKKIEDIDGLPPKQLRLKAFELTPFEEVKVVILGQDPYHTRGMAHGLAFSVPPHIRKLPPSLRNIFKEYCDDLGYPKPRSGDLTKWAQQGVLLLNTILTVEEGKPLWHESFGWEKLTIEVIQKLNEYKDCVVFILWGAKAGEYSGLIDPAKHLVINSPHPSPFSANKGFFGSRPFYQTNEFLRFEGIETINWKLQ